jgi:rubredoxin
MDPARKGSQRRLRREQVEDLIDPALLVWYQQGTNTYTNTNMIRTDLLTSYDFTDYICPMCGNYGTLLGVLGQLVHMRCAGCGCGYDFDYPHDDADLAARIDQRAEEYDAGEDIDPYPYATSY